MKSSRFNVRVVFFAVLIATTSALFLWAVSDGNKIVTSISLFVLWIVEIILLIRYVNKTNENLLVFLQSFKLDDTSIVFNKNRKLPFRPIYDEFNRIIDQFRDLKIEKEVEHQYFEEVIRHVDTGIIAWDEKENIRILNEAARKLLQVPHMATLNGLKQLSPEMPDRLRAIVPGAREIIRIYNKDNLINIYLRATTFNLKGQTVKLVSLQNIRPELEEKESDAWQSMIKVLTHEIVNSVGPIKLVSSSVFKLFKKDGELKKPEELTTEDIENASTGLKAIHTRSLGLSKFVDDYQKISDIPKPEISVISLKEVISDLLALLKQSYLSDDITLDISIEPEDLELKADKKMMEQILINLLKNAVHALEDHPNPKIIIRAFKKDEKIHIEIMDNGAGIPFNMLDYIFMPFFTTKKEGSGIGLTLARQLMKVHKGNIQVHSKEGEGTWVVLIF